MSAVTYVRASTRFSDPRGFKATRSEDSVFIDLVSPGSTSSTHLQLDPDVAKELALEILAALAGSGSNGWVEA